MPQFEKTTVHMKDHGKVEDIICGLIKGGASKLQVKHQFVIILNVSVFLLVKHHHLVVKKLVRLQQMEKYFSNYHQLACVLLAQQVSLGFSCE